MIKTAITHYKKTIQRPGIKAGKIRIAFITDLHNALWEGDPDCLPEKIDLEKPDLILCGGDMIIAKPGLNVENGLYFMRRMMQIGKVYFALGNHEYRSRIYPETYGTMYRDFIGPLQNEGVFLLDNTNINITVKGCNLNIYGLSLPRRKYQRLHNPSLTVDEMNGFIGSADPQRINILLAHNPKYFKTYLEWGADLTLCGHYHGGIIRFGKHTGLLSPGLRPFPSNAYGRFDRNGKTVIISGGLGEHTVPLRIRNPRELVIVDIYTK